MWRHAREQVPDPECRGSYASVRYFLLIAYGDRNYQNEFQGSDRHPGIDEKRS